MKFLLLIFVVAAVLLPLQAASLHKTWYKLAPSAKLVKSPNDIWSNCSECHSSIPLVQIVVIALRDAVFCLFFFCFLFFLASFPPFFFFFFGVGQPGDPAKIVSVVITPDPPVKGQPITIEATFNLSMCLLHLHF